MEHRWNLALPALPQPLNMTGIGPPQPGFRTLNEIMGQPNSERPKPKPVHLPPWPAIDGFKAISDFDIRGLLVRLTISTRTRRWRILSNQEIMYIDFAARKFRESTMSYGIRDRRTDLVFISNRKYSFSARFVETGGDEIGESWHDRSNKSIETSQLSKKLYWHSMAVSSLLVEPSSADSILFGTSAVTLIFS